MAIGTAAAILGGAAIGGTLLGASKAAKASKYAANQAAEASRQANELNRYIYDTTRSDNEPFRQIGLSAASAVARGFGLPMTMTGAMPAGGGSGGGTVSGPAMTGGARTGVIGSQGFGGGGAETVIGGPGVGGSGGGADWAAYGKQNPDVAAEWNHIVQTGNASHFGNDPNAYYAWHYDNYGKGEKRALPMSGSTNPEFAAPPSMTGSAGNEGYNDPTAPGGYGVGPRPEMGSGPAPYQAGPRMTSGPIRVSFEDYQNSPDYKFRVQEDQKALDNLSSSMGRVLSGSRIKAAQERANGLAAQGFTDYRNYMTNQLNLERARNDNIYESDRGFGYGQSRDARGDFVQDRARSDGLYADDRAYTTGRYDTRNSQLLALSGFGTGANAANQNAAQTFAQNTNAANMTAANARGQGAINGANAWNAGINNLMTTGAYLFGGGAFGGGAGASLPKSYNI
jgi:hypothetical protein